LADIAEEVIRRDAAAIVADHDAACLSDVGRRNVPRAEIARGGGGRDERGGECK
jgi:hypothetical protein